MDAVAGGGCVLAAPIGVLAEPGYAVAWLGLAAAGVCLAMRWLVYGPRYGRHEQPYAGTLGGDSGPVLPYSERRRSAARVSTVAFGIAGAALAWSAATIPEANRWAVVLGTGIAVGCAGSYLRNRRVPAGGVLLSPSGVTVVDGRRTTSLAWADVAGVAAKVEYQRWGASDDYLVTRPPRRGGPTLRIPADPLAIEPALAYWTLHHYAHHPADRAELAGERSVRRVALRDLGQSR